METHRESADRRIEPPAGTWVDTVAAILLAFAAVAPAWSSYQASRWTGEQAEAFSAANAARVESAKASDLANAQTEVDVAMFTEWVDAHGARRPESPTSTKRGSARSSTRP